MFRGSEWKIEKLSNELKMIFGCCGREEKSSLFIQRIIHSNGIWECYQNIRYPKSSFFFPVFASNSSQILAAYRIKFFFFSTDSPGFNSSIMQNTFYAREQKKNLSHVRRVFFLFFRLPKNYFCACYKTVIITWFLSSL